MSPSLGKWHALSVGLLALAAPGCSAPPIESGGCHCPEGVCVDGRACASLCSESSDCAPGLACTPGGGTMVCLCDNSACGPRQDCVDLVEPCQTVVCSARVPCEAPTDVCVAAEQKCLPANGTCQSDGDCPDVFLNPAYAETDVLCDPRAKVCRATPVPIEPSSELVSVSNAASIQIVDPSAGSLFAAPAQPGFSWQPGGQDAIVQVFSGLPSPDDFSRLLVWGATVRASDDPQVTWQQGNPVQGGQWLAQPPAGLGAGTYYVWVQTVEQDSFVGSSPMVPFAVGDESPWKSIGDPCTELGFPGDCDSPAAPLACLNANLSAMAGDASTGGGLCRQICASDLDCAPLSCLPPVNDVRVCGL